MSAGDPITLSARGSMRLAAVAVSHGWFQTAPFAWSAADERLERADELAGGPVEFAIVGADGGVRVTPSRPLSAADAAEARARLGRALQLGVDLTGFAEAVSAVDPGLARDLAAYGGGRMLAGGELFEDVVKGICGTNTTWTQAVGCINRLAALSPGPAFATPADLLRAGEDGLREHARVGYRAPAILGAARAAIDGRLREIEDDSAAGDEDRVYTGLTALAGIGPATAGFLLLLMGHFGRPSIDSATLRVAAADWFDGRKPTPGEVRRRIAPAGEFAGLVVAWATLRSWQRTTGLVP